MVAGLRASVFLMLCAGVVPCPSGYYAEDDYSCALCPAGKYKAQQSDVIPDPHPCFSCLAEGEWSEEGASRCACNVGYAGVAGGFVYGTCTVCAAGKFKSLVGDRGCEPCSEPSACDVGFFLDDCVAARDYTCKASTLAAAEQIECCSVRAACWILRMCARLHGHNMLTFSLVHDSLARTR